MSAQGPVPTDAGARKQAGKTRSAAIDAVRVLAVAAVIVGHAIPNDTFRQYLFAWHVPVFFFLSGYLWRDSRSIGAELRARTPTLAYPYLFWLAVVGVIYVVLMLWGGLWSAASVDDFVGPVLGGANAREPFTTFWFVTALFFVALLFRLIMPLPEWAKWLVVAVGLLAGYLIGPWLAFTPLAIGSALPCLVFLMVGRAMRPLVERIDAAGAGRAVGVGLVLIMLGEALVGVQLVEQVNIKLGDFGTPVAGVLVACAISVGLVLVAQVLFRRASARVSAATTALSYAGLVAVLLHPVLQWVLRPLDAPIWVFVVVMLVVPWAIGIALRHTPAAQIATGAPRAGSA